MRSRIVTLAAIGLLAACGGSGKPPAEDRSNKILWVSREPVQGVTDLQIRAVRGQDVVNRTVAGGPGPSTIDLPHPGCWDLALRWDGRQDHLRLAYGAPDPGSSER